MPPSVETRTVLLSVVPPPSSMCHDRKPSVAGSTTGGVRAYETSVSAPGNGATRLPSLPITCPGKRDGSSSWLCGVCRLSPQLPVKVQPATERAVLKLLVTAKAGQSPQAPAAQAHCPEGQSVQLSPSSTSLDTHTLPAQVSGAVHSSSLGSPQGVPGGAHCSEQLPSSRHSPTQHSPLTGMHSSSLTQPPGPVLSSPAVVSSVPPVLVSSTAEVAASHSQGEKPWPSASHTWVPSRPSSQVQLAISPGSQPLPVSVLLVVPGSVSEGMGSSGHAASSTPTLRSKEPRNPKGARTMAGS